MRPWKWIIAALFFASTLTDAKSSGSVTYTYTVVLTSHYAVDIDYNYNPFTFLGSKLLGLEPDSMVYTETMVIAEGLEISFKLQLVAYTRTGEKKWFFVTSDTTQQSFTHLPLEDKKELARDAILFVKNVRKFLTCRDLCDTVVIGTFHIDTTKTAAHVSDQKYFPIPDSGNIGLRGNSSRFISLQTRNASSYVPYITGNMVDEEIKDYSIYPYLSAYLHNQDIRVTLYLKDFSIQYKPRN